MHPIVQAFFAFADSWCHVEVDGAGNGDARKKKDRKATETTHTDTHDESCLFSARAGTGISPAHMEN